MEAVLVPACIRDNVTEIVTLATHRIRALDAQVGVRVQVRDQLPRRGRLAELVVSLEDVLKRRSMRTAWTYSAKFPIVVAVVAIAAEGLGAHRTAVRCTAAKSNIVGSRLGCGS